MARATALTFENRFLRLTIDPRQVSFHVREKASGVEWRMAESTDQDVVLEDAFKNRTNRAFASSKTLQVEPARYGVPGAYLRMTDLGLGLHIALDGQDVTVEIERLTETGPARVRDLLWPRHFLIPIKPKNYSVWTVGQGSIVPANMPNRFHHPEGYSEQEMAWHGGFADGCGMQAIAETPYDIYIAMSHLPKEAPATFIHQLPSLGDLRYTRRVRFHFAKGLDYVAQAKRYRAYMKQVGLLVTLAEKARRNPKVNQLKGAAVINSMTAIRRMRNLSYEMNKFEDQSKWAVQLKAKTGLKNGILHVDGWGKFGYDSVHPETLPPNAEAGGPGALRAFREKAREMGWLFGLHDQYIDIYEDAPSWDPVRLMHKENGKPNVLNVWAGGKCGHLCFSEAYKFVKRNFADGVKDQYMYHNSPAISKVVDPDAYYLDCFCRIHECHNPAHPLTRAEVVHYTNLSLRVVHDHGKGVVLSCEHPKFYSVPDLEFGWGIGHLKADVQTTTGSSVSEMIGTPVPLWHLVFHDCMWLPEYGADYLRTLLYGAGPYYQNSKEGPPPPEIADKQLLCRVNEVNGFDEMTGFKVVDAVGGVFESEFSSGVRVQINRTEQTYQLKGSRKLDTKGSAQFTARVQ